MAYSPHWNSGASFDDSVDFENGMRVFAACAGSGEHQITREPPFDVAAAFGFDMSAESLERTAPFQTPEDSVAEAGTAATKTKSKSGGTEPGWSSSETEAIEKRARRAASAAAAAVTNGLTNLGMLDVGKAVTSDDAAAGPGVTAALKLSPRRRHAMATALLQMVRFFSFSIITAKTARCSPRILPRSFHMFNDTALIAPAA